MTTTNKDVKKIDYLTEDDPIPRQSWACVSFLSPEGLLNCSIRGLKIRGVYATEKEAHDRAKELQKIDPDFNIHVGEVGKWLPWDPSPDSHQDQVYQEEELNRLAKADAEAKEMKRRVAKERREDMKNKAQVQRNPRNNKEKIQERLRKKLKERRAKKKLNENFKQTAEELEKEEEELNKRREMIRNKEVKLDNLSDKLNRMDELSKQLNE